MLKAIANAVRWLCWTLGEVWQGLRYDLGRLGRFLGVNNSEPMPAPYRPGTSVDDVLDEFKDSYVRELSNDHALVGDAGRAVHQYASAADPWVRAAVDVSPLSEAQTDWLLSLRDDDLRRLASAGPRACELAAMGRRSGIVGLPMPREEEPKDSSVAVGGPALALQFGV